MLHLRAFGPGGRMSAVAEALDGLPGARHVTRMEAVSPRGSVLVTADVHPDAADRALVALRELGVAEDDVALLRLDAVETGPSRGDELIVWADLLGQAAEHARPVMRYLTFMVAAGVIAAYGVLYANGILIVGAMAVSPDLLPITAICVSLALRRAVLFRHGLWTLAVGLACAGLAAASLTGALRVLDLVPGGFHLGGGILAGLTKVNDSTVVVALVAGVAGMLALETRASAAVGVAISVTTIPASAYLGVATGMGELGEATGALLVLAVNVAALVTGGTLTLLVQRRVERAERAL